MPTTSSSHNDEEIIELSVKLRELEITVKGPASQGTSFLASITSGSLAGHAPSPTRSDRSFSVVSSAPPATAFSRTSRGLESRAEILASFPPCPERLIASASRLGGLRSSAEERVRRAWLAGQWAKAVLQNRVHSPNRSEPLEARSRYYAVVRCDSLDSPVIFQSSGSYWRTIGSLADSNSVSHSFPSELEARTYIEASGYTGVIEVRP